MNTRTLLRAAGPIALWISVNGCASPGHQQRSYTVYLDPQGQEQTIAFEIAALPGEVFKIVIPEIITDRQETILEWNHKVPQWDIGQDHASWHCEVTSVIRMTAGIVFGPEVIEARVKMTNLTDRTWELANAFTCFAFYAAALFDNPELDRILLPVDDQWQSVADLFAETDPGPKPHTFFRVKGGPNPRDMIVGRRVHQLHPRMVDSGAACVVSKDGRWVAGTYSTRPAYVFCDRRERCIHANPLYDPIGPRETAVASTYIRIMRGSVADFQKAAGLPPNTGGP